jgi:hypothetical protein
LPAGFLIPELQPAYFDFGNLPAPGTGARRVRLSRLAARTGA